jgi:CRP-like cAMP-binding protein
MQSKDTITIAQFKKIDLFKDLTKADLSYFIENVPHEIIEYQKDEVIIEAGQLQNSIVVLLCGAIYNKRTTFNGKVYINKIYDSGEIIGITDCAAGENTSSFTIVAAETSSLLWIDYEKLVHMDTNSTDFAIKIFHNIQRVLSEEILQNDTLCEILNIASARERLLAYLDFMSKKRGSKTIKTGMNQAELADYLNIVRSTLSTEMNDLRKEGIIAYNRKEIKIL